MCSCIEKSGFLGGFAAAAAKSLQLCPTLCDPMGCCPPGSSVHGILQARVLAWGATAFFLGCESFTNDKVHFHRVIAPL